MSNDHILEYLNNFSQSGDAVEFAVLIDGEWGAGKTFFIDLFKKQEGISDKCIYVSLYGVEKVSDLKVALLHASSPKLAKVHSFFGPVAGMLQPILKTATGVANAAVLSQTGMNVDVGALGGYLDKVDFTSVFEDLDNKILIFDDLERTKIPIEEMFGYFNNLVEHQKVKVILVANEAELIRKRRTEEKVVVDKSGEGSGKREKTDYELTREKLVGRKFKVHPDFGRCLDTFVNSIDSKSFQKICKENNAIIIKMFEASKCFNLRALKVTLYDLEQLTNKLDEQILSKTDLVSELVGNFVAFSLELKGGDLRESDVLNWDNLRGIRKTDEEKSAKEKFSDKYGVSAYGSLLLSPYLWHQVLIEGKYDKENISIWLRQSLYFDDENTPLWRKLWRYGDLTENEFEKLIQEASKEFIEEEIIEVGEVVHLTMILLEVADKGLLGDLSKSQILNRSKKLIGSCKGVRKFLSSHLAMDAWGQAGFLGLKTEEFEIVRQAVVDARELEVNLELPKLLSDLVSKLPETMYQLTSYIDPIHGISPMVNDPILSFINKVDFFEKFFDLNGRAQENFVSSVLSRLNVLSESKKLSGLDVKFAKSFVQEVEAQAEKRQGRLTGVWAKNFSERLNEVLGKLEGQELGQESCQDI